MKGYGAFGSHQNPQKYLRFGSLEQENSYAEEKKRYYTELPSYAIPLKKRLALFSASF